MIQIHLDIETATKITEAWVPPTYVFEAQGNHITNDDPIIDLSDFGTFSIGALRKFRQFKYDFAFFKMKSLERNVARELSLWEVYFLCFTLPKISLDSAKALSGNLKKNHSITIDGLEIICAEVANHLVSAVGFNILSLEGTYELDINTCRELSQHTHELTLNLESTSVDLECASELANYVGYRLVIQSNQKFTDEVVDVFANKKQKNCRVIFMEESYKSKHILLFVNSEYHVVHQAYTTSDEYISI